MDEEPQPTEGAASLEARDEIVGQLDPFQRLAQHELARVQDERVVAVDRHQVRQVGLGCAHVDVRVAVVAEHAEVGIQVQVDRRRLKARRIVRVDAHAARLKLGADIAVRQDGHRGRLSQGEPTLQRSIGDTAQPSGEASRSAQMDAFRRQMSGVIDQIATNASLRHPNRPLGAVRRTVERCDRSTRRD